MAGKKTKVLTASKLRANLYRVLEDVAEEGVVREVSIKGKKVRIVPTPKPIDLERVQKRACIVGDPEDLVHVDWSAHWKP